MKKLKLILLFQSFLFGVLTVYAEDCPCDGGTTEYTYDCDNDGVNDACDSSECDGCDCDEDGVYALSECTLDTDDDGVDDDCISCSNVTIEFRQGEQGTGAPDSGGGSSSATTSIDVVENGSEDVEVYVSPSSAASDVTLSASGVSYSGSAGGTISVSVGTSGGSISAKIDGVECVSLSVSAEPVDVDLSLVP
jgi:hypothetical protein